jgi:hypothetical protein
MIEMEGVNCFNQPGRVVVGCHANPSRRDTKKPKQQDEHVRTQCEPQSVGDLMLLVDRRTDEGNAHEAGENVRRQAIWPQA